MKEHAPQVTNHTPKVVVKTKGGEHFNLYDREALAFLVWWNNHPGDKPLVEFHPKRFGRGSTFTPLHKGARGALSRSQLTVKTSV